MKTSLRRLAVTAASRFGTQPLLPRPTHSEAYRSIKERHAQVQPQASVPNDGAACGTHHSFQTDSDDVVLHGCCDLVSWV